MADRVTVDIEGLREAIEAAYSDNPLWEELSLSQKLRRLIQERLRAIEQEKTHPMKNDVLLSNLLSGEIRVKDARQL